ncbi:MAG: hypothetical protein ACN6O6_11870 [Pseudomonas sp.]|uniref:hypothetical protein n=1 Tax=Pseudomonas sp. TaxID=306 RepID=UPI003D0EF4C8
MHSESKHALGVFIYAISYVLGPFVMLFGVLSDEPSGYVAFALGLLALCVGHVFAGLRKHPVTNREAFHEVMFWFAIGCCLLAVVFFLLHRSQWLIPVFVLLGIAGWWLWKGATDNTRCRIKTALRG